MIDTHSMIGGGFGVALTTPFTAAGKVDHAALEQLVQHVVRGGADFVVALGSTGEASMLSEVERELVLGIVGANRGTARLVVGTGSSGTEQACQWTEAARATGADAALVTAPPYTRPTQAGIVAHFTAIARRVPTLPLIAYNVPSRTGVNILPETAKELLSMPTVIAIKESSGDLTQIGRIAAALPTNRALLAGDDALTLPTIAVGGHGVVSVAGNAVPDRMRDLCAASRAGDLDKARALHQELVPLFDALCLEPNPIPIKAALSMLDIGAAQPRLPLLAATDPTRAALQRCMFQLPGAVHHA